MKWQIGTCEIDNQIGLAPMAGISNPSYMKICEEMGVGWAVTELISAEAIVRENKKTLEMLNGIDTLKIPVGVQIFGSNPETMAKASQIICNLHQIVMIDINMGCPVPKVATRAQAGSALLKNPSKVYEIVKAIVTSVDIPVTVKIRSGWDESSINAVEIAKVIEKAGASAITVHPRTRSQGYSGKADWNIIKQVKENVKIPVIGNGDIKTCYDAKRMLDETGCDAVMIGRGLLGNPWLIADCLNYLNGKPLKEVTIKQKLDMILKHLNYLLEFKSEKIAILEMRTHISYYLKGISKEYKQQFMKVTTKEDFIKLVSEVENEYCR